MWYSLPSLWQWHHPVHPRPPLIQTSLWWSMVPEVPGLASELQSVYYWYNHDPHLSPILPLNYCCRSRPAKPLFDWGWEASMICDWRVDRFLYLVLHSDEPTSCPVSWHSYAYQCLLLMSGSWTKYSFPNQLSRSWSSSQWEILASNPTTRSMDAMGCLTSCLVLLLFELFTYDNTCMFSLSLREI